MKELSKIFSKIQTEYNVIQIDNVHLLTTQQINDIYDNLPYLDLLFIQPISDNYKNNHLLSTKHILSKINDKCKVIMIPVCYFNFYYPNVIYLKTNKQEYTQYYHDKHLLELYLTKSHNIKDEYKKIMNDTNIYSKDYLEYIASSSIDELIKREHEMINKYKVNTIITISNFIKTNYKTSLLFYTRNHPHNILLRYIMNEIQKIINISMDEFTDDPFLIKHPPIFNSVKSIVNFDCTKFSVRLNNVFGIDDVIDELIQTLDNKIFKI